MLAWILQITIISAIFIFLVHHLFEFFKSTLTVPKIKDLVNSPTQKYENMLNIITHTNPNMNGKNGIHSSSELNSSTNINNLNILPNEDDLLPKPDVESMKNELKSFLKKQLNNNDESNNTLNYSNY